MSIYLERFIRRIADKNTETAKLQQEGRVMDNISRAAHLAAIGGYGAAGYMASQIDKVSMLHPIKDVSPTAKVVAAAVGAHLIGNATKAISEINDRRKTTKKKQTVKESIISFIKKKNNIDRLKPYEVVALPSYKAAENDIYEKAKVAANHYHMATMAHDWSKGNAGGRVNGDEMLAKYGKQHLLDLAAHHHNEGHKAGTAFLTAIKNHIAKHSQTDRETGEKYLVLGRWEHHALNDVSDGPHGAAYSYIWNKFPHHSSKFLTSPL